MAGSAGRMPARLSLEYDSLSTAFLIMQTKDKGDAPLILALDTSSKATSIALSRGDQILVNFGARLDERRSARLWAEIEFLMGEADIALKDVDLFAVCTGPGGFTGLRVGIAAIKGLAQATGRFVIGITSLEAAAFAALPASRVCSMVNAYKGEAYSQLFDFDEDGVPVAESEPVVGRSLEVVERVTEFDEIVFAGDGVEESLDAISQVGGSRFNFDERGLSASSGWIARSVRNFPAIDIARLAFLKYKRGEAVGPQELKACYVRKAEAEVKLSLGLLGTKIRKNLGL